MEPGPVTYGSAKLARNLAVWVLTMQTVTARGPREISSQSMRCSVVTLDTFSEHLSGAVNGGQTGQDGVTYTSENVQVID